MWLSNNILSSITGDVATKPKIVVIDDVEYYSIDVTTKRAGGYADIVEVLLNAKDICPEVGSRVRVVGFIFAYYQQNHVKLCLYSLGIINVKSVQDKNLIMCVGTITRQPKLRSTPLGKIVCDVMLAVNNELGKTHSSYIPCICWNVTAENMSKLKPGQSILVAGRLQSREYNKTFDNNETVVKIAKELSINSFAEIQENLNEQEV